MRRNLIVSMAVVLCAASAGAQILSVPPSGDNQHAIVTQYIGVVGVTVDYHSPDVHAPNGDDRRGKIWGELVPYGLTDLGFGPCTECPWRAGANENTVFTVTHDVKVEGKPLPKGSYGLHMIPGKDEWTVVFSKNSTSWGSYTYDAKEDALRVTVKPVKNDYREWLTYEFTDRRPNKATVALQWEDLAIPFTISVDDVADLHMAAIREELRNDYGFAWANWVAAAQYAMRVKRTADALEFAQNAINPRFAGVENFQTLNTLANAQEAAGKAAEAKASRDKAYAHPTASAVDLHSAARQLLAMGKKDEAVKVWELNAKRNPNAWPVNFGLARSYSAQGRYKDALKYAKLALAQAPDEGNRKNLQDAIAKLEAGKDIN